MFDHCPFRRQVAAAATHLGAEEPPHMLLKGRLVQFIRKYIVARLQEVRIEHVGWLLAGTLPDRFDRLREDDGRTVGLVQSEVDRDRISQQRGMLFPSHVGADFFANEEAGVHELEHHAVSVFHTPL